MINNNVRFNTERNMTPRRDMVMRYNQYRLDEKFKYLCVVEGPTDRNMYGHSSIDPLSLEKCAYIFHKGVSAPIPDNDQEFIGKDAVMRTYRDVKDDVNLSQHLYRSFFIIDRDYEDEPISQTVKLSKEERQCFSITPYHSIECFFLTDDNLINLFNHLNVQITQKDRFKELLTAFRNEAADYFALIATASACYKYGWDKLDYQKDYDYKEIFIFSFTGTEYNFNKEFMSAEVKKLKTAMAMQRLAFKYYSRVKQSLMEQYLFIQGHTLFAFLTEYLSQVCRKEFGYSKQNLEMKNNYLNFISTMEIDLKLILGNGKPFMEK